MTLSLYFLLAALSSSSNDEWPGFRGPGGVGVATGSPPVEWSEEKNVRWKVEIPGKGSSSPVIFGDRVYLTTAIPTGKEKAAPEPKEGEAEGERGGRGRRNTSPFYEQDFVVLALDRKDGKVLWQKKAGTAMPHQRTHKDGNYASPTICTDGEHVIASFGSFGIFAYAKDGELVWQKDLGDLQIAMEFGEGSSPVLHGDKLIIAWDHDGDSFIVALDKKTGEEKWRQAREGGSSWATPIVVELEGSTQVVVAGPRTIAYDFETGAEVWAHGEMPTGERGGGVIASPVHHAGMLLLSTGSRGGALKAIRIADAKGEIIAESDEQTALAWVHEGDTPFVNSPIAYDGLFYSLKSNSGLLSAFDVATGETKYAQRMEGIANAYASPVVAGGRLYFADRDGAVEVVSAGAKFESLAVNTLEEGFDASPAVAGDELFLRGRTHLYCIAEK